MRILDEGVDLVKCDSVFISKITENSSDIRLIQRMCRANRLDKNNINKLANCFIWCEDIVSSIGTLEMLKNNDCELSSKIKVIGSNYERNDSNVSIEKIVSDNKNICEYINVKCMGVIELWMHKLNLVKTFIDKNKRKPNKRKNDENKIANFLNDMQRNYKIKSGLMKIEKVYNEYKKFLDEYAEYMRTIEEIWFLKRDLLFKYCNEFNKVPSKTTNYETQNIGRWFQDQKKKINSNTDNVYKILAENNIVKDELEIYLIEKDKNKDKIILSFDESKDLLFKYCNEFNKIPNKKIYYEEKKIGAWLQDQKKKIKSNTDNFYKILTENYIVKDELDRYLIEKKKNKDRIILSFDESKELLFKYCNEFNKIPIYKIKYDTQNIGNWLHDQKQKIKSNIDNIYKILSENDIVKKELDRYLINKNKNKEKIILSFDESKDLLFKYCNKFNKVPPKGIKYEKQNINNWLLTQKSKIKSNIDELYKILCKNEIVKNELDRYLIEKDKNKDKNILSFDESKNLLFKYCNEFNKVPIITTTYEKQNIGCWLQTQKSKIKTNIDIYKILSENEIVKKQLDKYLSKKI